MGTQSERECYKSSFEVGAGALQPDKEGKNIFLCARDGMKKIEIEGSKISPIEFEAFFDYRPYGEREYIFDHIWQQVNDKFYVADLQGTDWNGYKETYKRFLPYINNNYDFAEMLSEMLGELNGSHTGARYYASAQHFLRLLWECSMMKLMRAMD